MSSFAVIFDMDGVIVDSNPYHKQSLKTFCNKYGYDLSEEQLIARIYGRTNKEWIPNLFGEISEQELAQYAEEKESLFREIYAPHIKALAGIEGFIQKLQEQNIPRAIGTSAPRANVDFVLTHTQLGPYFDTILDESHVSLGKPNPEIYLKVAQALNQAPENCIVFEDSLSGVKAGLDAGAKVVGVMTTHTAEELENTHHVIKDFQEISLEELAKL